MRLLLRRHWITMIVTFTVVILCGVVFLLSSPSRYEAKASVMVRVNDAASLSEPLMNGGSAANIVSSELRSALSIGRSQSLINDISDHYDVGDVKDSSVSLSNPSNTNLIIVTAESATANNAQVLANGVAQELCDQMNAMSLNGQEPLVIYSVAESAALPSGPTSPKGKVVILGFLVLGFVAAFAAMVVKDAVARSVQDVDELHALLDSPVLGETATRNTRSTRGYEEARDYILNRFPSSPGAGVPIAITSVTAADVDESIARNMAASLSEWGSKVLFVETDGVAGSFEGFKDSDGSVGTDVLPDASQMQKTGADFSGVGYESRTVGPVDSQMFVDFIKQCATQYDYIVVDAGSLMGVPIFGGIEKANCNIIIHVVLGRTRKSALRSALLKLQKFQATPVGVISSK